MNKVMRSQIADYLNVSTTGTPEWVLLGTGVNTLNESPNAQIETKTYVSDVTASSTIKSYNTQFAYDADLVADEKGIMFLNAVGRDHKVGQDAETDFIRVDLYDPVAEGVTGKFKARKFRVAIEVSSNAGAGGEAIVTTGNLNCVGDPTQGYFDTATKTFTAGEYSA